MICFFLFFFFKQKTAYEMRISDWSSDVCSSDLVLQPHCAQRFFAGDETLRAVGLKDPFELAGLYHGRPMTEESVWASGEFRPRITQIGRESCRERVCQTVSISVVAVSLKTKNE